MAAIRMAQSAVPCRPRVHGRTGSRGAGGLRLRRHPRHVQREIGDLVLGEPLPHPQLHDHGDPRDDCLFQPSYGFGSLEQSSARIADVRRPSDIFMAMDSEPRTIGQDIATTPHTVVLPPYWPNGNGSPYWLSDDFDGDGIRDTNRDWLVAWDAPYNNAAMRHDGGVNALHADGHAGHVVVTDWVKQEHWDFRR